MQVVFVVVLVLVVLVFVEFFVFQCLVVMFVQQQEIVCIVVELGWDGYWLMLVVSFIMLCGVVYQMVFQSELVCCEVFNGGNVCFYLCILLEILCFLGSIEKLIVVLFECFGKEICVEIEIGVVFDIVNVVVEVEWVECQCKVEQKMKSDFFVMSMMCEFGVIIVLGLIQVL